MTETVTADIAAARPHRQIGRLVQTASMSELPAVLAAHQNAAGIRFALPAPAKAREELDAMDRDTAQVLARYSTDLPLIHKLPHVARRVSHLLGHLEDVRAHFSDVTKGLGNLPAQPPSAQVFIGNNVGGKCAPWHFDPHGDPHEARFALAYHLRGRKLGVLFATATDDSIVLVPVDKDEIHASRTVSDADLQALVDAPEARVEVLQQQEEEGVIFDRNGLHASSIGDGDKFRCMIK